MHTRLIGLLVGAMAIALIVAGCGSSNDNTESTASLTKAQFLKQGNAICKKGNDEIEEGFEAFAKEHKLNQSKPPTEAELEEVGETILIPAVNKQIDGIRALGTPKGDEGEVKEILAAAEEAVEEAEENPASIANESDNAFAHVNKLSREYGLTACGEEGEGKEKG